MEELVFGRRYRAIEKIGTGGMADVYKAVDDVLGRTVAVKVMHARYASDPAFAARFRHEAQAAANLVSPNIVNMYDWGQDGETYYIVMEYVRGTDLKTLITQKGALPSRQVAEIGAQVCSALAAAHGYDIIHRDIKPHNIMVQPDGTVKVMDFGIARAGNSTMTQTGSVLGTAHYVSPEQAQGKTLTNASDLYSLGVVLYEASTGNVPFDADTPVAVALKQVNESALRPSALNPDIDPALEAVIGRAMAKRVDDRYVTADEMRRDLLQVAQGRGAAGVGAAAAVGMHADDTAVLPQVSGGYEPTQVRRAETTREKRPVWPWFVLAVLLVVGGLSTAGAMGLLGGKGKPVPDVVGKDRATATAELGTAGFVVGNVAEVFDDKVAKGLILTQTPTAGTSAKKGTAVDLVLSKGQELVEVPDVKGLLEADAIVKLRDAGFTPQPQEREYKTDVPVNTVFKQSPAAQTMAARGSIVEYTASLGTEQVSVPAVEGLSESAATKKLKDAGFKVKVTHASSETVKEGYVISQDRSAGGAWPKGTTVTISVSTGPAMVKVPNEVGKAADKARDDLEGLGFKVEFNYNLVSDTGLVVDQLPKAGTEVKPGSTVTLSVDSAGP